MTAKIVCTLCGRKNDHLAKDCPWREFLIEHRFHATRRWRFDFAHAPSKVAIEIEGGSWVGGRHTRGAGFIKDLEKYAEAARLGWVVLRFTPQQVQTGYAHEVVDDVIRLRSAA